MGSHMAFVMWATSISIEPHPPPKERPLVLEVQVLPAARIVHHGRQALVQKRRVLVKERVQQRLVSRHEATEPARRKRVGQARLQSRIIVVYDAMMAHQHGQHMPTDSCKTLQEDNRAVSKGVEVR